MRTLFVLSVCSLILLAGGCGREDKTVYSGPDGKIEVSKKGNDVAEMKVTTQDGTATISTQVSTADLGALAYPGADQGEGGGLNISGNQQGGAQSFKAVTLYSKDPIDKVAAYYKQQLQPENPQVFEMSMPDGKTVSIAVEKKDKSATSVILVENKQKSGTNIQITRVQH